MNTVTKKIIPMTDFVSASEAATLLSQKLGRPVRPDYVRKLKSVRFHKVNGRCLLYHKGDLEKVSIRKKQA